MEILICTKVDQAFIRDTRRYKSRVVGAFSVYYYFLNKQKVDLDELRKIFIVGVHMFLRESLLLLKIFFFFVLGEDIRAITIISTKATRTIYTRL